MKKSMGGQSLRRKRPTETSLKAAAAAVLLVANSQYNEI
jgi:hypothetical protein